MNILNKLGFVLSFTLVMSVSAFAQENTKAIDNKDVLLTVDGEEFTAGEFMYVYNKNNRHGAVLDKKTYISWNV